MRTRARNAPARFQYSSDSTACGGVVPRIRASVASIVAASLSKQPCEALMFLPAGPVETSRESSTCRFGLPAPQNACHRGSAGGWCDR